jgi:transposase
MMDNLAAHKESRVRELIEAKDCELLSLPPYSPDLNPIHRGGLFEDQGAAAASRRTHS